MRLKKWLSLLKRKFKRLKFPIFNLLIIIFILGSIAGIIYCLRSEFFQINNITCEKEGFSCKEEMVLLDELKNKNIFMAKPQKLALKIKEKTLTIKSVVIKKQLPNKVLINIIPRKAVAAITKDEKVWFLIDEDYFVYKKVFVKPMDLAVLEAFDDMPLFIGKTLDLETAIKSLDLLDEFKRIFMPLQKISFSKDKTIIVYLSESTLILFSSEKPASAQVDSLQFILRHSKIEGKIPALIDLRFDKPVVKY